jgi:hypothetical protein
MPKTNQMVAGMLQSLKVAAFALLLAGAADAQEHSAFPAGPGCTTADFQGTYGYSGTGTIVEGPTAGPVAFVGQLTANGKGAFFGGDTISRNGEILHRTYTAAYAVNPDCTGSYEADTTLGVVHADFVIVAGGEELRNIRTDPGQVLTFNLKKLHLQNCSVSDWVGSFGYSGDGKLIQDPILSIGFVGRLTADGSGGFVGGDTISRNGEILHRTYTATYTVNPDCTGSYEADTTFGVVHADFVIVGNGDELRNIRTDEGQVLTFQLKKQ